jgi:hypothetical protein
MTGKNNSILWVQWARQILNVFCALTQFFVPFFSQLTGIGQNVGARLAKDVSISPEVPAGYAFSIWFVIFTLSLIYAVYQALPAQRNNKLLQKIGWWTACLFFLSTLWMLIVQIFGDVWPLVIIIVLMFIATLCAFFGLLECAASAFSGACSGVSELKNIKFPTHRVPDACVGEPQNNTSRNRFNTYIMFPLLGLYAGWLSVATFLSIASTVKVLPWHTFGLSINAFAILTLIIACIVAVSIIIRSKGNRWYAGTILWALMAVIVANISSPENIVIVFVAGVLALFVALTLFFAGGM